MNNDRNDRRIVLQITITTSPMGEAEARAYALTLTDVAEVVGTMAGCDATLEIGGYLVQDPVQDSGAGGSTDPQNRIESTPPRDPSDPRYS